MKTTHHIVRHYIVRLHRSVLLGCALLVGITLASNYFFNNKGIVINSIVSTIPIPSPTPTPIPPLEVFIPKFDTHNWKQFTNDQYTLEYPDNWIYTETDTGVSFNKAPIPEQIDEPGYQIIISSEPYVEEEFRMHIDSQISQHISEPGFKQEIILLSNKPVTRLYGVGSGWPLVSTYADNDGFAYNASLVYFSEYYFKGKREYPEAEFIYNQMLTSLQFKNSVDANKKTGSF